MNVASHLGLCSHPHHIYILITAAYEVPVLERRRHSVDSARPDHSSRCTIKKVSYNPEFDCKPVCVWGF